MRIPRHRRVVETPGGKRHVEVVADRHVQRVQGKHEDQRGSPPGRQPRHRPAPRHPQHEEPHHHAGRVGAARDRQLGPEERDHRGDDKPDERGEQIGDAEPPLIAVRAWRRGERHRLLDAGPPDRQRVAGVGRKVATEVNGPEACDAAIAVPRDDRVAGLQQSGGGTARIDPRGDRHAGGTGRQSSRSRARDRRSERPRQRRAGTGSPRRCS